MTPHLVKWHEQYAADGLQVVEINHGGIDSLADLTKHLTDEGIEFPVLHDKGGRVTESFGVRAFPTAYLFGRDGSLLWSGHPRGSESSKIEQALSSS